MTRPRARSHGAGKESGRRSATANGAAVEAATLLREAAALIESRAPLRDRRGLRANALAAVSFNALRGTSLSEEDVCTLLLVVKLARAAHGHDTDNFRDAAAYAALAAEAATKENR